MSDDADLVQSRLEVEIAGALSRIDPAIPAGVAGECDECGELMPRLVAGRCAFCRDGRRPPLSTFDRLAPPVAAPVAPRTGEQEKPVAQYKDGKYISVPCEKRVLRVIERNAAVAEVSLGAAALDLIEAGIRALDAPAVEAAVQQPEPANPAAVTVVSLGTVPVEWLTDELTRRFNAVPDPALVDAAVVRAEAAEGQLATLREQLRGLVGDAA